MFLLFVVLKSRHIYLIKPALKSSNLISNDYWFNTVMFFDDNRCVLHICQMKCDLYYCLLLFL